MAKYAALTVRKLKPGSYDEWRAAWEGDPENWPKGVHAYILRNLNDPDEIIAFGLTDRSMEEMREEGMEEEAGGPQRGDGAAHRLHRRRRRLRGDRRGQPLSSSSKRCA